MTATPRYDHVRLSGTFTLRSPLSHIGESVSTTTYLAQEPIVQPDGTLAEVFSYSGNAWRGQLRDIMARRTAVAVGGRLPVDAFHLLFSGGRIEQDKGVDLEGARTIRDAVTMLALLGGGIGSQILCGRLRVFNCYPVCREAIPVLPEELHGDAGRTRYGMLTYEREFTRFDDSRREDGGAHLEQRRDDGPATGKKARVAEQQMRMGAELVAPGTRMHTEIHGMHLSRVELGCLALALEDFGRSPCIGGQSNRGHGLVSLAYALSGDAEDQEFVRVDDDGARLSGFAADLRDEYLEHLSTSADAMRAVLNIAA